MRFLITGTPCAGKTTLSLAISKQLDCPLLRVNDLVQQTGCFKENQEGEKEVDLKILEKHLKKILKTFSKKDVVVEGHLLADMRLPCEKVLVLRVHPKILLKRMKERKYAKKKTAQNLLAEILDYSLIYAEQNYGKNKVLQLDFTKPFSARKVLELVGRGESDFVDWTPLLLQASFRKFVS